MPQRFLGPKHLPTSLERICQHCGCCYLDSALGRPELAAARARHGVMLSVEPDTYDKAAEFEQMWATWLTELYMLYPGPPECQRPKCVASLTRMRNAGNLSADT